MECIFKSAGSCGPSNRNLIKIEDIKKVKLNSLAGRYIMNHLVLNLVYELFLYRFQDVA